MKKSELKEYIKSALSENATLTKDTIQKKYNEMFGKNPQTTFADVAKALNTTEQAITMALMGSGELFTNLYMKEAGEKTAFIDGNAVEYKDENELRKFVDNVDTKSVKTASGKKLKEDEEDGIDTSMDKVSKALTAVQKQLDQMFADFKSGKYTKDEYMDKRKALQAKRDKLNAALISFEEDEDEL